MFLKLGTFLLALSVFFGASGSYPSKSKDVLHEVVRVYLPDHGEGMGICTAFPVGTIRYVTAAHCVQDVNDHVVLRIGMDRYVGTVGVIDRDVDLASIDSSVPRASLHIAKSVEPGDKVRLVVFPDEQRDPVFYESRTYGVNLIMDKSEGKIYAKLVMDKFALPGMSGGPILNERNEVVSVLQSIIAGPTGEAMALGVPPDQLQQFLVKIGL